MAYEIVFPWNSQVAFFAEAVSLMFKGAAKIEMNEEAVVEALQEYFDKRLSGSVSIKVKSIKASNEYQSGTFVVETTAGEPAATQL